MASPAQRAPEKRGPADPESFAFADDGVFPNSRLPVLIYRGVLATPNAAAFDRFSWQYYVRDVFDLFYAGYWDSWPSLNGATVVCLVPARNWSGLTDCHWKSAT
jgi:hypothetical protein